MNARWLRRGVVVSSLAAIAMAAAPIRAQQGATGGEWRTYAGDLGATKYAPLTQIDATNFSKLAVVWRWQSADGFMSRTIPGRGEVWASSRLIFDQLNKEDPKRWREGQPPYINNFKATPLMVGGRLYLNTPTSIGAASSPAGQNARASSRSRVDPNSMSVAAA